MPLAPSDSALLDAVRTIRWPARRKSPAGMSGNHLSRILGVSAEFTEYRAYRQGDEVRRIDWKLLARSNRAYIRLSNDRTVLSTMILVDASGSMAYPVDNEKWHFARQIAMGLAAAAHRSGDPVGLLAATAEGPRRLPPRTRRGVVQEIAQVLNGITPTGNPELAPLVQMVRTSGRIAIVSDFLGDAEAVLKFGSQMAAAGREVHVVHVMHGNEVNPPARTALLTDPEDADLKRPLTDSTLRRYLHDFRAWRDDLATKWRSTGAFYTPVVTSEPVVHAVRKIAVPGASAASGASAA